MKREDRLAGVGRALSRLGRGWLNRVLRLVIALAVIGLLYPMSGGRIVDLSWLNGTFLRPANGQQVATVDGTPAGSDTADSSATASDEPGSAPRTTPTSSTLRSTSTSTSGLPRPKPSTSSGGSSNSRTTITSTGTPRPTTGVPTTRSSTTRSSTTRVLSTSATTPALYATFFQESFNAGAKWSVREGIYLVANLAASPVGDDNISSIQIDPGLRVLVCQYSDANSANRGSCISYVDTVRELGSLDNQISYIEVVRSS